MARYWVGGTGTWDASDTSHWAAASGGASGASVPTSSDDVYFDGSSDSGAGFTVTISGSRTCNNLTASGLDQTLTPAGVSSPVLTISGTVSLPASNFGTMSGISVYLAGSGTVTTNGVNLGTLYITGTRNLSDALNCNYLYVNGGTFTTNNYAINIVVSVLGHTGAMVAGTSVISIAGTGTVFTYSSGTWSGGTILLTDTSTTARTFAGGGGSFGKLTIGGTTGTSTLTITGANTFTELASTKTVAHTIVFPNSTTTVGTWSITGTSGNVVTMTRTGGSGQFTLALSSGYLSGINYLSISNGVGYAPIATWYVGANSTNGGGNTGFIFTARPAPDNFLQFFGDTTRPWN